MDRISFIPFFLERWPAYMSISIQCKVNEVKQVEQEIKKLDLPDRVAVILLTVGRMNDKFYVNRLRNLAITAIRTTHFFTLDMDMWPIGRNREWRRECGVVLVFESPFSSFIIHHSPSSSFIIHHSSFIIHHLSFIIHHSSFIIHHSPFTIHHSSFIIHHSLLEL